MILRLVGAQLDSRLLSQGSVDPGSVLVRSVQVFIGQEDSSRGSASLASIPRWQRRANSQGRVSQSGRSQPYTSSMDADEAGDSGNSAPVSSSWNNLDTAWNSLDTATRYMFYASLFAVPSRPYLLNLFA